MIATTLAPRSAIRPEGLGDSADRIHRHLVEAHRIGNRARLRFARLLAAMAESRNFLPLGHPSIVQYAEHHFGVQRAETYELIRVADVIDGMPESLASFDAGAISWTALKHVTRVASAETETKWLDFARRNSCSVLRAEVQDAMQKNRAEPSTDRRGLPNLTVRFTLELTLEERERLSEALASASAEIAPPLNTDDTNVETKDALLYLVERFLRTAPGGTPEDRTERSESPYAIVYHRCSECRRARILTADGPAEVPEERVEQLRGDAVEVVVDEEEHAPGAPAIDRPNTAALARCVKLREGGRCGNPGCRRRRDLHAHHIHYRADGGRTVAANEVAVCATCHALIHAGLLAVSGDPFGDLCWRPRSAGLADADTADVAALGEVPVVRGQSARPDEYSARAGGFVETLVRLGLPRRDATERVASGLRDLRGGQIDLSGASDPDAALLRHLLQSG